MGLVSEFQGASIPVDHSPIVLSPKYKLKTVTPSVSVKLEFENFWVGRPVCPLIGRPLMVGLKVLSW